MQVFPASCSPAAALVSPSGHGCSSSKAALATSPLILTRPSPRHVCNPILVRKRLNPGFFRCAFTLRVFSADSTIKTEKWILQPIGDGDCSHLDEAVPLPGAFEVASESVTVGRVPERADIVIPIATVSGLHARLERKGGTFFVTDLDSTNGTFIDNRKLRPGAATPVPPGSRVTFGFWAI